MLEIVALLVYVGRLAALARSRGRSSLWSLGGLALWLAAQAVAWLVVPHGGLVRAFTGLALAGLTALVYYRLVDALPPRLRGGSLGRGDNFPCPCCTSLQTEDRSGLLACHACGGAFRPA